MNNLFLKKIIKNFNISLKQYDNYSASKYWKKSINKKKKLFKISNLNNFRNNGLSNNIDDFYINEDKSKKLFENLKNYCGEKFLSSLLETKNVGQAKKTQKFKNKFYTPTDLFSIKYAHELKNNINLKKINLICEIGQGFGLLASKLLKIKKFKMILIDLPESNFITAYYLKILFPKKKIFTDIDLKKKRLSKKDLKKADIFIISPWTNISDLRIDLFINSRSMMEMNKKSINNYFKLIQSKINIGGYFLCINKYYKDLVGYPIEFHLYPFDFKWKVIVSKRSWMQPAIHFFLLKRLENDDLKIKLEINRIKKNYLKLVKKDKFFLRRMLPISFYRFYKNIKYFFLKDE
jgi:putative sugar O-methyltransferase